MTDVAAALGQHLKEIARLEGLKEVELDVTELTFTERVRLPAGLRVAHAVFGSGQVLWSPPSAEAVVEVEASIQTVVTTKVVPILPPVRGVFVRGWEGQREDQDEEKQNEEQLGDPSGVVVGGNEVFVCDCSHHRVQVFGLDGSFVRQWGSQGDGQGQFSHPCGVSCAWGGSDCV